MRGIPRREGERPAPLSFQQEQLWLVDQLAPGTTAYALPTMLRLTGRLDASALERTLEEIARRHESLRTRFPLIDGQPVQLVDPARPLPLPVVDLSGPSPKSTDCSEAPGHQRLHRRIPASPSERLRQFVADAARQPFDLAGGPLLRAWLLRTGGREHRLFLLVHHTVFDAWSQRVLIRELAAIYAAFVAGEASPLPAPPVQYGDFAAWQREQFERPATSLRLDYWRERLRGPLPVLELPAAGPRPPVQTFNGTNHRHPLPESLLDELTARSRQLRATLYMTLLAAFATLLHRYTGERDIVIGTTVAGRDRRELEAAIGFYANTLVLRTDAGGDPTFSDLVGGMRETVLGALEHSVPLGKVVEAVRPAREVSHAPLFQILFVVQEGSPAALQAGDLTVEIEPADLDAAQFDLNVVVSRRGCRFEYNTDVLDAGTVGRLAAHFEMLLHAVAAEPERHLSELPIVTEGERRQLLATWNETGTAYPEDRCVHELFERSAAVAPDAIAVVAGEEHLSYGELDRRANRLAHWLRGRGARPDELVGIAMERAPEMVVAIYGVLKAGAAYLPLDPTHPAQRQRLLLRAAAARVLLTQERFRGSLAGADLDTLHLDSEWGAVAGCPRDRPAPAARPDNLAYVMHTSGSTGQPKGVMTTHRNLVDVMAFLRRTYRLAADDRVLQHLPFSFDMSDGELFLPLVSGACAVLAPPAGRWDPDRMVGLIRDQAITSVQFVPTVLAVLFERAEFRACRSLRHVLSGGDALATDLVNRFLAAMPWTVLHNFYGPTEATMGQTYWPCAAGDPAAIAPIGAPIDNVRTYVLDRGLRPLPVGATGELCIGGVTLARGYLRQPDATAAKFVPDPYGVEAGARMYRSGDLARWRPDGTLEFVGRVDHQVKLRGFRMEPAEVQAALDRHPGVRQSFAMVRDDGAGDRSLVAYVVPEAGREPSAADLRGVLREWLPEYMVPSAFVLVDAFPLTSAGKVDRGALPAPERERAPAAVLPSTGLERVVAEVWGRALRIDPVGVDDNFFDLGGHSLLMVDVQRELARTLDRPIVLLELFEHPTVGALAAHLGAAGGRAGPDRAEVARAAAQRQRSAVRRLVQTRRERGA
jgi:amino acid adenylation domain-containing protein